MMVLEMAASSQRLAKYRLPHLQTDDAELFITFCTLGRMSLPSQARHLVLEHCRREPRIHLSAIVVMPDHVHLLLMPLRDENGWPFPLIDILQCLKSVKHGRSRGCWAKVWEEESFDDVLRSDESLKEKCEYIRQNPVEAGLVRGPEDYRWLWIDPQFKI